MMTAWCGRSNVCWVLLLLPPLLLAQDYCSHNCKNEANRYYYLRPEGSAETLCPAQPCLTPSQLREHFSECERNNSCQTANTSLVLLPGTYSLDSNKGTFIPPLKFLSLTGYNEDTDDSLATPTIDCNGTWISLKFKEIKCVYMRNCIVFTGDNTNIVLNRVNFHDSLIRLASADHSELYYNYKLGSERYCILQKQLADANAFKPSNSVLALRNVSFSNDYHYTCDREYGIQLTTIHAVQSTLDIADCLFTQNGCTHISLLHSTLHTSGMVLFQNANTAIYVNTSNIELAGVVKFSNNNNSAIRSEDTHSTILLAGTVEFTNNTADYGGAILVGGNMTIEKNSQVVFRGNQAKLDGGAIISGQHTTISGSVLFINNSANNGGAIHCVDAVISDQARVTFCGNNVDSVGGAIHSLQSVALVGIVEFINNSASQGGAIDSHGGMTIAESAHIIFSGNYAEGMGGAIASRQYATVAGTVQFTNNSAHAGGAIVSAGTVSIADNAQVLFQYNHADTDGGAIYSDYHVSIASAVQFINNHANQGGAISSENTVSISNQALVIIQGNHADSNGGGIHSNQRVTLAGTVYFINNGANQGGAIDSNDDVTITADAEVIFSGNNADTSGGAIISDQHVTVAGAVQFISNSAQQGAAVDSDGSISIAGNTLVIFEGNNVKGFGGAIACHSHQNVTIAGTVRFTNNSANKGGAIASAGTVSIADNAQVLFQDNHADTDGGAIYSEYHVTIASTVQFINNQAFQGGAISSNYNVSIGNNAQVVFQGNYADNVGGAILSNVVLGGNVQFISNTAQIGGAVSMFPGPMTITNNAEVTFQGNRAYRVGGAISSGNAGLYSAYRSKNCLISFGINSTTSFINNTAECGGSAMYGITMSIQECGNPSSSGYEYLYDVLTIIPDSFSAVSSDPLRVCICPYQSTPDCLAILPDQNTPHLHYTVYPGQNFTIPAAVVGFNFALTSGSAYAQFLRSDASLGSDSQYVQGVNQTGCSQLQYSVLSNNQQETLLISSDGRHVADIPSSLNEDIKIQNDNLISTFNLSNPNKYFINNTFTTNLTDGVFRLAGYVYETLLGTPVFVSVKLLDCPPGFTLTVKYRCDCYDIILKNHLICNITDQTVRRHGTIWVNASFSGNTSNGAIVHKHCPFQYCIPEQLDVNLTHPETQCAFDRYGTLCGACKPDFSLALGGSRCLPNCSNKYLLLLISFFLAGFVLVFFIKILNLTVSQGTINGIVLYANIVAANRSIFFPAQYDKVLSFLSVFISWLNLDLGIETCLIKGLDGYWKTWLQFVFPFYVWLLAGAIILASHYSTHATKIFGDNSVSVLATLLLLSYAKLLRSIITIFSFTTLEYPDNTTDKVWSFDGNLQYLNSKHIPLFLFALITLLLLWLPYTAVLLSAQWLRTQTHRKGLRWLKPFLDAYYGPFKDNHHYWVGVLLVVRGVLFVLFASFFAIENNVNLLLISVTSLVILIYTSITGRLYKTMYLTLLENSFFFNIGVLSAGTFYIRLTGDMHNQQALATSSVGIAFLKFCGITIFHSYQFVVIPIRRCCAKLRAKSRYRTVLDNDLHLQSLLNSESSDDDSLEYMPRNAVTHSEVRLSQLREEAQHPPNPSTSEEQGLPQAKDIINSGLAPFNCDTPRSNTHEFNQIQANKLEFNENMKQILIPFSHDTSPRSGCPTMLPAAIEAASTPSQSEAAALSMDEPSPPPPQASSASQRYFAAEREERFIDFNAPRETLLEYTQYRLPHERNEPARDSTAERELLSAPHEHPQESSESLYFAAEREGCIIDFSVPRESLLDYTQ